jgi:flagellar hook-associated protein FlgK
MNSANNVVDTSAALNGNGALASPPPAAGIAGTLTVLVDGVSQTFNYNTAAGGTDTTIDAFISHFNGAHLGVTASFNATSQTIVFARDPMNIDLAHRAAQGATPANPTFTITDNSSLLTSLGASAINGVQQNSGNAFGANDNGAANALLKMFSASVGVPALQTTGSPAVAGAGTATIALPAGVTNVGVGDVLTIDAGLPTQENVVVSAITFTGGVESFTATFKNAHALNFSITSAQTQTLSQYYGQLVTQIGVDTQTAITGSQSQTQLASNIDKVRQSVDGINIDEETQNLIKFQNAYQATARSMNILDSLLSTVINTLGTGH